MFEYVWLATNGKKADDAIKLANLANGSEVFSVTLSQDRWHEPISQRVVQTFKAKNLEIRSVTEPIAEGRAKEWGTEGDCICSETFITPSGDIKWCGCSDSPIVGNVFDGIKPEYKELFDSEEYRDSGCHKKCNTEVAA
jgi:hypothetical protein